MSAESATRRRILAAAAPLFADRGFEAVGVRDIAAAAEVNLAAISYHFGGKDGLIDALCVERVKGIEAERLRLLDLALAGRPTVESILEAFMRPAITRPRGAGDIMPHLVIGRGTSDARTGARLRESVAPVARRFVAALTVAMPGVSEAELTHAFHLSLGAMLHTLSCADKLDTLFPGLPKRRSDEDTLARLVAFTAAGLRAVVAR